MRRSDVEDTALAVAVAALGQVDVWAPHLVSTSVVGPRWFAATCYTVTGLALAWRRRRPFATACVVLGVAAGQALVAGASEGNGVLVPTALAVYSVAANAERSRAFLALALVVPVAVVRELNNPDNVSLAATANALAWYLVVVAAWLLGAYLRTRRLYVGELAARAARAEAEREERATAAVTAERERIAREMHDILAHSISVIVVQAEAAEEMLDRDPPRARLPLQQIQRTGREALVELRHSLGALRGSAATGSEPPPPQPGLAAVPTLVAAMEQAGLRVDVTVEGESGPLAPGIDLAAYRIVQEALTNALKHARAARARVTIRYAPQDLHVEVRDDGQGGAAPTGDDARRGGHGLVGMRQRVAMYGGEVQAGPGPAGGYVVRARLSRNGGM